ncbi:cytoplasmic dynein 2 heavy chain 1, partial [Silurus meridionalis]
MAPMLDDDSRKLFLLTTVGNYFSLKTLPKFATCTEIDNFLDDANEFLLAASTDGDRVHFSNR